MPRARNIKPGFFTNDSLGELPPLARLMFVGLCTLCDRSGRLEDRPKKIKAEVLPYDVCDPHELLALLSQAGFIRRYEAGGLDLIQVVNWDKHQTPHVKEQASTLPAPGMPGASTCAAHLIPDSGFRIPDSSSPTVHTAAVAAPTVEGRKSRKTPLPADFAVSERVRKWATLKGYDRLGEHLEAFRAKCAANDYRKLSWDDAFMEAIREDWAKLRGRARDGSAPPPDVVRPGRTWEPEPKGDPESIRAGAAAALAAINARRAA